jgi:RHS repeat-associated protein
MTPVPTVAYDANGNTLSDPSGKSYSWDFENRLMSATVPGTGTVAFKYDPLGRRIQKSSWLGTTNYLFDGINLLEEMDNAGNLLARYTQTTNIDELLSELRSGTTTYYQQDGIGSVSSLSSPAGVLANTYTYDSFGKLMASTGTLTNPFQFTGRQFDTETGIYYHRARYFDENLGRFISEDPIRFKGGHNFYRYSDNSPTNLTDPTGLAAGTGIGLGPGPITFSLEPWAIFGLAYYDWKLFSIEYGMLQEYRQREHPDAGPNLKCLNNNNDDRCKKIREECMEQCWEEVQRMRVWPQDRPGLLRKCTRKCMNDQGCYDY